MISPIRPYDRDRDLAAAERIWREVSWITSDDEAAPLPEYLDSAHAEVADVEGSAECLVLWHDGTIQYQDTDLPLCAVTAVTTSRLGRKRRFATTLTARAVASGAESRAAVAALGMFEQGFYDRIGFGTGPYTVRATLDPRSLRVEHVPYRQPVRLSEDDHEDMHRALLTRRAHHGRVTLAAPEIMRAELRWVDKPFGLGYRDDTGRLSHFVYGSADDEHGPYRIRFMGYEHDGQLLELLRLLRELGDQVATVVLDEPPGVQLQDLVATPLRDRLRTTGSTHATGTVALAWMQLRILDLEACIGARRWSGPEVAFDLRLHDPVAALVDGDDADWPADGWRGVGGDHHVVIGAPSTVTPGMGGGVPVLTASIGAFSRCWFGVRPATGLALTDDLDGPPELLRQLDEALALPPPFPGWDF
ncbi:MAG: hypothetical protein ACFCVK_06990 [Acidimicrobiales bacterium]